MRPVMPELDTVRGIAVSMVLLYHALFWSVGVDQLAGAARIVARSTQVGWLGVQLFFVLSGFLITGILVDSRARPDYFRRFYTRRALRILPAYVALLAVLAAAGAIGFAFLATSFFFMANLTQILGVPMQYGPLWSLAVEEQFYLVWPLAARRLRPAALAGIAAAIVLLTPVVRLVAWRHWGAGPLYGQTWFVADGLALGALVAIYLRSPWATRASVIKVAAALVAIGAGALAVGVPFGILHRTNPLGAALQLAPWHFVFAGGLLVALLLGTSRWRRFVLIRPLRYLGRISYGLYLIHVLVLVRFDAAVARQLPALAPWLRGTAPGLAVRLLVVAGASIAIAALSREYLEEFFLRRKDRLTRAVPAAEGATAAEQPQLQVAP